MPYATYYSANHKFKKVATMTPKKDNQTETIIIEATAWTFVLGIIYLFAKILF